MPHVNLGISFLVDNENVKELSLAYKICNEMGVRDLFVRAKTYVQAIDLVPLLPESRKCVLEAINSINYSYKPGKPNLNVEEYYLEYLKYNVMPNTQKEYKKCFFVLLDWLLLHQSQV